MGNENIKIGARNLEDEELKILLPEWKNIFLEIEKIREVAGYAKSNEKIIYKKEQEFTKHHNNVFSILGERGAGKTSVQLSLKYKIMKKNIEENRFKNDTVLPLIVPQDMEEDSVVIAWIIAYFSKIVEEIEEEFATNRGLFSYKGSNLKINPISESFRGLKRSLFIRTENYKKSLNAQDSIVDYVEKNEEVIREDINLSRKFKEFIDEYIEYKKQSKVRISEEPLIYVFFDDVDISNRKCLMVLETIMRYLSHSHIVVFVAGDYSTFKETVTLKYLKDDGLLYKELLHETFEKKTALEIRQTLAYDYLKKVLSPALRYELKKFNLNEKQNFRYLINTEEEENRNPTLEELIKDKLGDIFIEPYYEFLDSKPRGLINIYYYLNRMKPLKDISELDKATLLKKIVNIVVDSSSDLNTEKDRIDEIITIKENSVYINFEKFNFKDFSKLNLMILYVILFMKRFNLNNSYDRDILNYFVGYFKENINVIDGDSVNIYDVFLEKEDLYKNAELFYKILNNIGNGKIEASDFIYEYFAQLKFIFSDVLKYYNNNLTYHRDKIKNILQNLEKENKISENLVITETRDIFKNLYMIDEVKEIIETPRNLSLKEWENKNSQIIDCNYLEFFKYSSRCIDIYLENGIDKYNVMQESLLKKLNDIKEGIQKFIYLCRDVEIYNKNFFNKKPMIFQKAVMPEKTFDDFFLISEDDLFYEKNPNVKIYIEKLIEKYKLNITLNNFKKITNFLFNGDLEQKILIMEEVLKRIELLVFIAEGKKILSGDYDMDYLIEEIIQLIQEKLYDSEIFLSSDIVLKLDFIKRHYFLLMQSLKYEQYSSSKLDFYELSFEELRKEYIEIYKKVLSQSVFEYYSSKKRLRQCSKLVLDFIGNKLFEIESRLISDKNILYTNNLQIIEIIRENQDSKDNIVNRNNFINRNRLIELYFKLSDERDNENRYSNRRVKEVEFFKIKSYLEKEIRFKNNSSFALDYKGYLFDNILLDINIYIELFKIFLNEDIKNKSLKIELSEKKIELGRVEARFKRSSNFKRFFSESIK